VPHVIVKLWPGKSEAQKRGLSDAIVRGVTDILNYGEESVSVGFEEVARTNGPRASTGRISKANGKRSRKSLDTVPVRSPQIQR
jgi:phenylpyruvate tautomerase PptA (4-oxalocrotonate tautomerase family)